MSASDLVVGLDVGTTKVLTLVGEVTGGRLRVIGLGHAPATGLHKGVLVDLPDTVAAIRASVRAAEQATDVRIGSALVSLSGEQLASLNSRGSVPVEAGEVDERLVREARRAARQIVLPPERVILHNLPRQFVVDGQDGVRHPVGMAARYLEVETHVITAGGTFVENLARCVQGAGLGVEEIVATPLASGLAVTTEAERELGVLVVDLGGGATHLAVMADGSLTHTSALPVGGGHLTHDLSVGLRLTREEAERVKRERGCAQVAAVGEEEYLALRPVNEAEPREVPRRVVAEILEPRVAELAALVRERIAAACESATPPISAVLTGGGSLLPGLAEIFGEELNLPTRLGLPRGIDAPDVVLQSPAAATAVGLVQYGALSVEPATPGAPLSGSVLRRLRRWFATRRPRRRG